MAGTNRPFDRLQYLYISATSTRNYKEKRGLSVIVTFRLPFDRPVPNTEGLPVPVPLQQFILDSDEESTDKLEKTSQPSTPTDADFTADLQSNEFHRITQQELNDLIMDLDLPKSKAELLFSRLQQWNLLKENVRISVYCKKDEDLL